MVFFLIDKNFRDLHATIHFKYNTIPPKVLIFFVLKAITGEVNSRILPFSILDRCSGINPTT